MVSKNVFIVTGPESSGKSTLSNRLREYFDGILVEEYARKYIENLGRIYDYEDLAIIAEEQWRIQTEAEKENDEIVICDTGQLVMKIWSEWKYGKVEESITKRLAEKKYYLLCRPDIPWEFDEQRENPDDREELFDLYLDSLKKMEVDFEIIEGDEENRFIKAVEFIEKMKPEKH